MARSFASGTPGAPTTDASTPASDPAAAESAAAGSAGATAQASAAAAGDAAGPSPDSQELHPPPPAPSHEDWATLTQAKEEADVKLKEMSDQVMLTMADMENLRQRSRRQEAEGRRFAVAGFVKDLLPAADNLERAQAAVPSELLQSAEAEGASPAVVQLKGLLEGVQLTERTLLQAFKKNGLTKMEVAAGGVFDPNLHDAIFNAPNPELENGTIHSVVSSGYLLHDRVVRAASVGVVENA